MVFLVLIEMQIKFTFEFTEIYFILPPYFSSNQLGSPTMSSELVLLKGGTIKLSIRSFPSNV